MASNEESEDRSSRGNDWEVVSLTASTYAAAPGSREAELKEDEKVSTYRGDEAETSRALFLSGHFLFPPIQHENLPLEHDNSEIDNERGKDVSSDLASSEGGKSGVADDENWAFKGLNVHDEFLGLQFFDGRDNKFPIPGADFDESPILKESNMVDKEQDTFDRSKYGSEQVKPSPDISESPRLDKKVDTGLPCGAWWKRRASSMYAQAKEANAFWSIFIAAAVMGIVILGKRWQQERWQTLQLKLHMSINDQKMSRIMGHMTGLQDAIVVGQRRGSFITSSSSN